ncbi:MAG: T9SS type A sorting domain-containing protein [Candidatus Paceibacterota bacterium]
MKRIISFFLVVLFFLVQSFVQAQIVPANKGFPDGWTISGWDATKAPSVNQTNPNNLLPREQQKIGFGEWVKLSNKTGSVTTSQFSLTGVTNLSVDVAYNEYYISYMKYNISISTNNGLTWHQVWAATSTGSTNWKWRVILLNLSSFSENAKLKFVYDGPAEGDLVAFDLGKLWATGLFTPTPPVNTAPVITLIGANPLYITNRNDCCVEPGYSASAGNVNLTNSVVVTSNLDCANLKNGTYTRTYTCVYGGFIDTKTRVLVVSGITGVDDNSLPMKYLLSNYPNPFNPTTTIKYDLPEASNVKINVYNTLGQNISTLVNEYKNIGQYEIDFNAVGLPSGIYFYTLETKNKILRQKMMFLK